MNKSKTYKAIVALSGGITYKGTLPYYVKYRLDEAYKQYHAGHGEKIIVCGKWSYHLQQPPQKKEADAMAEHLRTLGVPTSDIIAESKSIDLISCAVFLKKEILPKHSISSMIVIGSDFQEERIEFIWKSIFRSTLPYTIALVPSRLPPDLLWKFFLYDRETYMKTRLFLRSRKISTQYYTTGEYKQAMLYKRDVAHFLPQLVYSNTLGRSSKARAYYSLASIYRKRIEVFEKYNLDANKVTTLKADFWSGRFLNFLGRDADRTLYCLKFALKPKDKQSYKNEVLINTYLQKHDVSFVPTIIDHHTDQAPLWYLYKIVIGRMSGEFSRTYSFADYFFQPFVPKLLAAHIRELQTKRIDSEVLPVWDGAMYSKKLDTTYKRLQKQIKDPKDFQHISDAHDLLRQSFSVVDSARRYLSHNDLHPGNIIISTSKKKLYFIDFENTGYNNLAFDFCFVYLFSWNKSQFQKKLIREYLNVLSAKEQIEFLNVFPYVYLYFLLWFLRFTITWKYRTEEKYTHAAKSYAYKEINTILTLHKKNAIASLVNENTI